MLGLNAMSNNASLVFYLISFVLGLVVLVWAITRRAIEAALIGAGIATVALPLLWGAIANS